MHNNQENSELYTAPEVVELGPAEELTLGGSGFFYDNCGCWNRC